MRIGFGYDVHRLVSDRPLILGGVTVPFDRGLLGHSDADVLTHAVCDAILGAAAQGDIGTHFPDTDPEFAGADSLELLSCVGEIIAKAGYALENLDATLVAQKPKIFPYKEAMRTNLARALGIPVEKVSVKATTTEKLGPEGREEGMSAMCVCLLSEV